VRENHSRRQLLAMVGGTTSTAGAAGSPALADTTLHPVRNYQVSLAAAGGGTKVRLTSAIRGEVFDLDLSDAETRGHFMKLLELAVAGRGRMSFEVEIDTRTVRTFVLDVP